MAASDTAERRFYLEHFRGRSLIIGQRASALGDVPGAIRVLVGGGARVIRVLGSDGPPKRVDDGFLGECWTALRTSGSVDIEVGRTDPWHAAADLADHLRPFKLVLIGPDLPHAHDEPPPFITIPTEGWSGARSGSPDGSSRGESRAAELAATELAAAELAARALAVGVGSVNACRAEDVLEELLTYRGAGVLFTSEQYCTVQRLGLDDYESAHRLIEQGVAEGYLLPRSEGATARLLISGYGARFGDHHLAGFAALLTDRYSGTGLAEVSAVTTISRFAGGGVGGNLVRQMVADARDGGLVGVFACTTSAEAVGFFTSLGFEVVDHDRLPAAKWAGYDGARRARITALLHPLGAPT